MADLLASQVSLAPVATDLASGEFFESRARRLFTRRIKITSATVGGSTNKITAAALGFKTLVSCGDFYRTDGTPTIIPAAVDPINNVILLGAGASNAIGDMTSGTGFITVKGS